MRHAAGRHRALASAGIAGSERRNENRPRAWWKSPWLIAAALLLVTASMTSLLVISGSGGRDTATSTQVPAAVLRAVTAPPASVLSAAGAAGQPLHLARMPAGFAIADASGRPLVVYVGAEYCPFCAAERWSMVMALSRFGGFTGLTESTSSSTDAFPDTSTFTFVGSTFSSSLLSFQPVEVEDRDQQPLQSPSAQVARIFATVDRPPYTATANGFPFLDIGGRYVLTGAGFSPALLQGLSWEQIARDLGDPGSPVTAAIAGHANELTAAICSSTAGRPSAVCDAPTIRALSARLNMLPVAGS